MLGLPYHINEIATLAGARDLFQGCPEISHLRAVAFDSRKISRGAESLFVALKTPNRDGHEFIADAYQKGVRNFVSQQALPYKDVNYALCDDSLDFLQLWAMQHRQRFDYPVIAITGSNGKTIVKEWLATLLEMHFQIVKSPMSYNSQLGVALSLLQMGPTAELALIEAGISQAGEMEKLWLMIQPDLGILTHMGSSHAEGFDSEEQKLEEKLLLFEGVKQVLVGKNQPFVLDKLRSLKVAFETPPNRYENALASFVHSADRENVALCLLAVEKLGIDPKEVFPRIPLLYPVEMRSELITDNPEITLINDSYNSDEDSVRNALQVLLADSSQEKKQIILSDIPHLGKRQKQVQTQLLQELKDQLGQENIYTVGPMFYQLNARQSFLSTDELLDALKYEWFKDSTLLLKGSRNYELERLIPFFNRKLHATYFKIRLHKLIQNFRKLKSLLPDGTRTMCMVKAGSYGSGTWEISQTLQQAGADYLAVAYASEGIELRQAGITLPIMVMNPDQNSIAGLLQFGIEPEVSNLPFLEKYLRSARLAERNAYKVHLKIESGMGRLGFTREEIPELIELISQHPDLEVVSVLTHLAAADDPEEDEYSLNQIENFLQIVRQFNRELGIQPARHILNTAGILRFTGYACEMVRMGIGLYGISPFGKESTQIELEEIGSLHSVISQIRTYPSGTSIGYGRSQTTKRRSKIATVAIGYADGIPRSVGNGKASFMIQGKLAPTFGRICMDMMMLDVTDIPEAKAGDSVLIFGKDGPYFHSINHLAQSADTIAYEILVRMSNRIRRIYERE